MAVKAIAYVTDIQRNEGNNNALNLAVTVTVLGANIGTFVNPDNPTTIMNVDVSTKANMLADVNAKVKTFCQDNGVTFGADTVVVMPN